MIKVERISKEVVSATITRGDEKISLFEGQILHGHDIETLEVKGGVLVYSVDELELVEVVGKATAAPQVANTANTAKAQ